MKNIVILGSSGSIGKSVIEVVREFKNEFKIIGLAVRENIEVLIKQVKEFLPAYVAILNREAYKRILVKKDLFKGVKFLEGEEGIEEVATLKEADIVVNAIVGSSGLRYTYKALESGNDVALANKESLVMAGEILNKLAKKKRVRIIPVDSEHSAIFNLISNRKLDTIERIILTASGGPFRLWRKIDFKNIKVWQALKHPTWKMGSKITIDSATMANKGFEVIEAHYLFDIPYDKIDVVIHPQSLIHSMIETINGEIYAQISLPDMRYPILNALSYPEILKNPFKRLELKDLKKLTFEMPDYKKFPLLSYAYEIGKKGGNLPAAFVVADDIAVKLFLKNKIKFNEIFKFIKKIVEKVKYIENPSLNDIFETEKFIYERIKTSGYNFE